MNGVDLDRSVAAAVRNLLSPDPRKKREGLVYLARMVPAKQSRLERRVARHVAVSIDFYMNNAPQVVMGSHDAAVRIPLLTGRLFRVAGNEDDAIRCLHGAWREIERNAGVAANIARFGPPPLGSQEWGLLQAKLWSLDAGDRLDEVVLAAQVLRECADSHMLHDLALWPVTELQHMLSASIALLLPPGLPDGRSSEGAMGVLGFDSQALHKEITNIANQTITGEYFSCLFECCVSYGEFILKSVVRNRHGGQGLHTNEHLSSAEEILTRADGVARYTNGKWDRTHVGNLLSLLRAEKLGQSVSEEQVVTIINTEDVEVLLKSGSIFLLDDLLDKHGVEATSARLWLWRRFLTKLSSSNRLEATDVIASILVEPNRSQLLLVVITAIANMLSDGSCLENRDTFLHELLRLAARQYSQLDESSPRADGVSSPAEDCLQRSLEQLRDLIVQEPSRAGPGLEDIRWVISHLRQMRFPSAIQELVETIATMI